MSVTGSDFSLTEVTLSNDAKAAVSEGVFDDKIHRARRGQRGPSKLEGLQKKKTWKIVFLAHPPSKKIIDKINLRKAWFL
jgi:hypothetical protein